MFMKRIVFVLVLLVLVLSVAVVEAAVDDADKFDAGSITIDDSRKGDTTATTTPVEPILPGNSIAHYLERLNERLIVQNAGTK